MKDLAGALAQRRAQHLYRRRRIIDGPTTGRLLQCGNTTLLSFCSNDYLGLANHPEVIKALQSGADRYGVGSGASHLISGHSRAHHELEQALAEFCGQPRALLFSTGYMANLGVIATLSGRNDNVFQDRLNHASLIDGAMLSGARLRRYAHGDMQALRQSLVSHARQGSLIASDGVFSMDGDIAPLTSLLELATEHDSWLLLDEAHALGVIGKTGRGSREHYSLPGDNRHLITLGTLGKALGTSGAFVAGSNDLIETLIQQARTYIYTTALPPAIAHATLTSLALIDSEGWRLQHLGDLIRRFTEGARQLSLPLLASETPIQPVLLGDSVKAQRASEYLLERGLLVIAIRPPTVPRGQARLRITLSAAHQADDVDRLLEALSELELDKVPA